MTPETRPVRYRVELYGLLHVASPPVAGEAVKVRILDLSDTGAFVERPELPEDPQEGDPVTLTLALPGSGKWAAQGTISRLGNSRLELKRPRAAHVTVVREGFGVEFLELDDVALEQLREFLELVDGR